MKKIYGTSILFFLLCGYSGFTQITRPQILSNAAPFGNFAWTTHNNNIWNGAHCGSSRAVYSPNWVTVGTHHTGMPYCWGGFNTTNQFIAGMNSGKSAGDACSGFGGQGGCSGLSGTSCGAGCDCSGFVSEAWGISYHCSTSCIPSISTAWSHYSQLLPGDCLNYASSHVRLVLSYNNGTISCQESCGTYWKNVFLSYTPSQVTSYSPRYYNHVVNALPPPTPTVTSNNNCGDKTLTRANPPSGCTYYWQGTNANGTNTGNSSLNYTANVPGTNTYYLRAKYTSGGAWSASSSKTVTIKPIPANAPIPTATTNQCGAQTLTRAAPPAGEKYYWQGTTCGTNSSNAALHYTAPTSGIYKLRARDIGGGCWATACSPIAVSVAPTPAPPSALSQSSNSCGPVTLTTPNAPGGQTYYWQGTSCGISTTDTFSTHTVTASGQYYLRSLSSQACWSNCSSVGVTIVNCPNGLNTTISGCPNATVNFNWLNSNTNWVLQVSLDSAFSSFYSKPASNVTVLSGSSGFTPALTFQANATYYWRIMVGNVYTDGPTFTIPFCDIISPATIIDPLPVWQDSSFTATFTDTDDSLGSGIGKSYYRVIDFNGTEWRANGLNGFANDNFDNALNAEWTGYTGTWANATGFLIQSDDSVSNSNLSGQLTQNLSNKYLYHWNAKIEGGGSNRQGGFHFFSDSASLPNRGNSYFVMFRVDENKLQFFKVTNDIPMLVKTKNFSFVAGQFYDFKLVYSRITGKMDMYIDNTLIDSWQDGSPIATGKYVSFRTTNASMKINYFKVFRSRASSTIINVGAGTTNDIRYENTSPSQCAGKIESIVTDVAGNLSTIVSTNVNVDRTAPSAVAFVNDGSGADITVTTDSTELTANWSPSSDPNSGIAKYHYTIGTSPGDTSTSGSTDNFIQLIATKNPLTLIINQIYYFNIWSENGAGMLSSISSSNGQMVVANTTTVEEQNPIIGLSVYPSPFENSTTLDYKLMKSEKVEIGLFDLLGKKISGFKNEKLQTNLINFFDYMFLKPLSWFLTTLFRNKGILDGYRGFIFSLFSALRFPRAYWRYINR